MNELFTKMFTHIDDSLYGFTCDYTIECKNTKRLLMLERLAEKIFNERGEIM